MAKGRVSKVNRLVEKLSPLWWKLFPREYVSNAAPIVIGGCPRSGTTLLRMMLDSHARICCGPETRIICDTRVNIRRLAFKCDLCPKEIGRELWESRSRAEFTDRFFRLYCASQGKPRWAEKTPKNIRHIERLFRHFPRARFVHVIRDGRDTVCSLRTHPRFRLENGTLVPNPIQRPLDRCAQIWRAAVEMGVKWRGHPNYREVHYEQLVLRTEETLRELFEWLEEPWDPAVLRYHEIQSSSRQPERNIGNPTANQPVSARSVGRWRNDLTAGDVVIVLNEIAPVLERLGYTHAEESGAPRAVQSYGF